MISIVTHNIKNFKSNHVLVKDIISNNKVIFLIEHWLSNEEKHILENISSEHRTIFYSEFSELEKRRGRPFGGTSWMIHNDYELVNNTFYDRHLSTIEIKEKNKNGKSMIVIGVWMPFDDGTNETWSKIQIQLSSIQSIIDSFEIGQNWLIIGDFNMDISRKKRADVRLKEFVDENYLEICENRFIQDVNYSYRNGEYRSHIDHVICNEHVFRYMRMCKLIDYKDNLSDHLPIITSINKDIFENMTLEDELIKKFHRFHWENEEFKSLYKKHLDSNIREIWNKNYIERVNDEIINNSIKEMHKVMIGSARKAEKELGLNKKKAINNREINMDSEINDVRNEVNYWHSMWKDMGDEESRMN